MPADFISLKVGINIQGQASMSERTFGTSLIGFVQIIREKHPCISFVVISPIYSPPREEQMNGVGFNLIIMREHVEASVKKIRRHGDDNIYYVDGLMLFGPEHEDFLPDDLHPNSDGYKLLGTSFLREVAEPLFSKRIL